MSGIMTKKEMQSCMLGILTEFADYCDRHGLIYVISSGTLLGAVRHKGFIPWDDDIDVDMPRDDYEKFCSLSKSEPIADNLEVQNLSLKNAAIPFTKVVDLNTEIVNAKAHEDNRLWIDVFPVDGMSQKMIDNYDKVNKRIWREVLLTSKASHSLKNLDTPRDKLITVAARLTGSAYRHAKRLSNYAKKHKMSDCPYAASITWGGQRGYMDSKTYFENRVKVDFEGKTFWAVQNWDKYLTKMYGDYMTLPPENERDTHGIEARYIDNRKD